MRHPALTPLLIVLPLLSTAYAEDIQTGSPSTVNSATHTTDQARIGELEQALAKLVEQRNELARQQESRQIEQESAQMTHLRQENQKLRLQLREALAQQAPNPLSETQTWYLVGAITALFGAAVGALLRGNRRRRQWIN